MLQFQIMSSSFICVCFCVLVLHTSVSRASTNSIPSGSEISRSIYSFGTELMKGLAKESATNGNIFVSPLSAYLALSMVHLATEKETRSNLDEILKISKGDTGLHEKVRLMLSTLANKQSDNPHVTFPEMRLSNGLFMDDAFPINAWYTQQLKTYYGQNATVTVLNFEEDIQATKIINSWISQTTKNRIENFLSEPLPKDTRAVLTSAIYFKGPWQKPFRKIKTETFKTGKFNVQVPMMSAEDTLPYYTDASLKFDSIEVPYSGEEYAMMIVLPHASQTVRNLTQYMHLMNFDQYKRKVRDAGVAYKIPKMKISSKRSLVEALQLAKTLDELELRGMTNNYRDVIIKDVKQAAEIEVDENGTIATAVTVAEIATRMLIDSFEKEVEFIVDRPFIVYIVHKPTYVLVFSGIVHQPQEGDDIQSRFAGSDEDDNNENNRTGKEDHHLPSAADRPRAGCLYAVFLLLFISCSKFLFN